MSFTVNLTKEDLQDLINDLTEMLNLDQDCWDEDTQEDWVNVTESLRDSLPLILSDQNVVPTV